MLDDRVGRFKALQKRRNIFGDLESTSIHFTTSSDFLTDLDIVKLK